MRITVDEASAGLRLDAFLARAKVVPSAAAARRVIADGRVRVDGRQAVKGARLQAGQVVEAAPAEAAVLVPCPEVPLEVLHEDAEIVAIAKPAGMPSHPLRPGEAPTAAGALAARYPECAAASVDPREGGLAHRLDGGTSGVLLAARSAAAWRALRAALAADDCEKVYLAEVVGRPPDHEVVTAAIGRSGRRGSKVRLDAGRSPLAARTEIRLLEARGATSLVEARLAKGRPHQVRAHLASLGTPVVGDDTYGSATSAGALHLHAMEVCIRHPRTGEPLRIVAPPPLWGYVGSRRP